MTFVWAETPVTDNAIIEIARNTFAFIFYSFNKVS